MDYSQLGNKKRKRNPHTTRVRNKVGLLVLRVVLAVVLIFGSAGVGGVMGAYFGILDASPTLDISVLRLGADGLGGQSLTSFIVCSRTHEELERLHDAHNHEFVPISEMPRHLIYAFVAIEDERFFEHNGVDPRSIMRAIYVATVPDRPTEGGSTITQQLVKNMLEIWDNTFITKLQEQHLAVNFERHLVAEFTRMEYEDPQRAAKYFILESYLNMISLGRQNYGVGAAAWFYFNIDTVDLYEELTIAQAAVIAAITQNPSRFPPDRFNSVTGVPDNWRRTQQVLNSMLRLGFIDEDEHAEAMAYRYVYDSYGMPMLNDDGERITMGLVYDTLFRGDDGRTRQVASDFDCFTDALLEQVRDDLIEQHNINADQANRLIFTGGLRIYSTQDRFIQNIVDDAFMDESLFPGPGFGFTLELTYELTLFNNITLQPRFYRRRRDVTSQEEADAVVESYRESLMATGDEIRNERIFLLPQPQSAFLIMDHHTGHVLGMRGIRGEKQGNRVLNRATGITRSPGSQMKPLVPFGPLFDLNLMSPSTVIDDIPFSLPSPYGGRPWEPQNWWATGYEGLSTARRAIYRSMNVVSARAAIDPSITHAGMPTMVNFLQRLGISTIHPHDGPAIVLGGMTNGVSLIELAGAYAAVANSGYFNRPVLYTHVTDSRGNRILDNSHAPERVMRATTAYLLTHSMQDTVIRGTGVRVNWESRDLRGRIPIAGKTGTSQGNRNLGFVGFTPYFTAAVWMGNDNYTSMHRRTNEFHTPLWRHIMEEIHRDMPARAFNRPADIVTAHVCRDSGLLPTHYCTIDPRGNRSAAEVFARGMVPTHHCTVHQQFTYCTVTELLASAACHYYNVVTRVGLVRTTPLDPEMTQHVQDRHLEFSEGVLIGLTCHCGGGSFWGGDWENPIQWGGIPEWNEELGQWVTPQPPQHGFPVIPPVTHEPDDNEPEQPPWGFGGAPVSTPTPQPDATPPPFVNSVPIPGLE